MRRPKADSGVQEQMLVYDFAVKPRLNVPAPPAGTDLFAEDHRPVRSSRVQRRRERTRAVLLAAGARQFALRGIAPVSVEDVIAEADVSRATFYALFSSKYSLLEGILNPLFELATRRIQELSTRPAEEAIDGLVDIYWSLWTTHRDGLMLIPLVDHETFVHFEQQHSKLQAALLELLLGVERADLLRNGSAQYSLKVIARTAVQLLRVYDGHAAAAALFRDAVRGLLLRAH
jgi:AcrR family transcriptional regulator